MLPYGILHLRYITVSPRAVDSHSFLRIRIRIQLFSQMRIRIQIRIQNLIIIRILSQPYKICNYITL